MAVEPVLARRVPVALESLRARRAPPVASEPVLAPRAPVAVAPEPVLARQAPANVLTL